MRQWRSKLLTLTVVAWFVLLHSLHSSPSILIPYWEVNLEHIGNPVFGAPNEFKITVTTKRMPYYNSAIMEIKSDLHSATIVGQSSWTFVVDTTNIFTATASVMLEKYDSTCILFYIRCPELTKDGRTSGETHRFYVVTTESEVGISDRTPWSLDKPWPNPKDLPRGGFPIPGEFPEDDSLWGILKVEPVSLPKQAGPVDLRVSFTPTRKPCDSVKFSVRTAGDVKYSGDTSWVRELIAGVPIDTVITVTMPDSSRGAVYVDLKCGGALYQTEQRLFTVHDTLEYYSVHPWHKSDCPSIYVPHRVLTGTGKLREMEKTPLVGSNSQFIEVDGVVYMRREGEHKFRVSPPITDFQAYSKQMQDSLEAIPLAAQYDVKFSICDTVQLNIVKARVMGLVLSGEAEGCQVYFSRVTKKILMELAEKGIKFQFDAWDPVKPDAPSEGTKPETSIDQHESPYPHSLNENFEGVWPNQWSCRDENDYIAGIDYWGRSSLLYHSGFKSVWCSGVGNMTDGGYVIYCLDEANINATGIIDLADLSLLICYLTGGGCSLPPCPFVPMIKLSC